MYISDAVLSHHFKNVIWLGGGPCAGKTTMSNRLAEKYDLQVYHCDEHHLQHKAIADPQEHPAMKRHFAGWDEFFNRPVEEYVRWLEDSNAEQMQMVIADLLCGDLSKTMLVEGILAPGLLRRIAPYNQVVFLFATPEVIREQNFDREQTSDMMQALRRTSNPKQAKANVLDVTVQASENALELTKESGLTYFVRDLSITPSDTFAALENFLPLG